MAVASAGLRQLQQQSSRLQHVASALEQPTVPLSPLIQLLQQRSHALQQLMSNSLAQAAAAAGSDVAPGDRAVAAPNWQAPPSSGEALLLHMLAGVLQDRLGQQAADGEWQ